MDSILSVQNKDFTRDGENFVKILGAVAKTQNYFYGQFIGIWSILWRSLLESLHVYTTSTPDKWHRWKSRTKSERRYFGTIATIRIGWEIVGWFFGMLLLSATCPRPPGRGRYSVWKTIRWTFQTANDSFWSNGWMPSDFTARLVRTSSIWQESTAWYLSWARIDRGRIWKGDIIIADLEDLEKLDASDIDPRRINAREAWISQKGDEFIFLAADATAKLSGRDYEFRQSTLRREQTARREDVSRELQGKSEGPQPTESKDDAEVRADFWSIQGDIIYRRHNEPRVQLFVPKEETFLVPLKYIDVRRSIYSDLDVMQEKRIDDCWNVDSNRSLPDSWKGFTKFTLLKEKLPKGYMWSGRRMTKAQTTTRPVRVCPEVWTKIGKAAQESRKTRLE